MFCLPGEKQSYFRSYLKVARTKELQERLLHAGHDVGSVGEEKEPGRAGAGQAASGDSAASSSFSLQKRDVQEEFLRP